MAPQPNKHRNSSTPYISSELYHPMPRRLFQSIKRRLHRFGNKRPFPLPLPQTLARSPSPPMSEDQIRRSKRAKDQSQSSFFRRLPLEIRRLIYTEVLGLGMVHMRSWERSLWLRRGKKSFAMDTSHERNVPAWERTDEEDQGEHWPGLGTNVSILPFLQTCRQV